MKWITKDIVTLLSAIEGVKSVLIHPQGGDVDTSNLIVNVKKGEPLFICGFITNGEITTPDDAEIEMIEVTDGQQSDTGLISDNENTCLVYARVVSRLRKAGFQVVESLKAYF